MFTSAPYYLVVDLEATCDDRGGVPRGEMETIEVGAVLVDGPSLRPVAEFQRFVRPRLHPQLTAFCRQLTTITQADVDAAPSFPDVASELAVFGKGALFCSWGDYDRNQLDQDARLHGIRSPLGPDHANVKKLFATALGLRRGAGNRAAMRLVNEPATGTHHRGIDDARNIARLLPYALGRVTVEPVSASRGPR